MSGLSFHRWVLHSAFEIVWWLAIFLLLLGPILPTGGWASGRFLALGGTFSVLALPVILFSQMAAREWRVDRTYGYLGLSVVALAIVLAAI